MFGIEKDFQKLMEQAYGPLGKKEEEECDRIAKELVDNAIEEVKKMTEIDISKVLIEGDTATIMGVKYKRVEEPPTLSNKLEEWIEILNFTQSKEHKDLLVIEILNIVKEFIPEPYEGVGLSEYFLGYNDAIRQVKMRLFNGIQ